MGSVAQRITWGALCVAASAVLGASAVAPSLGARDSLRLSTTFTERLDLWSRPEHSALRELNPSVRAQLDAPARPASPGELRFKYGGCRLAR